MSVCVCAYVDDSWAVGAYEAGGALAQQLMFDPHHVLLGDALCDAHHQGHLRIDGFNDGRRSERRGHINHRGIGPCCIPCLGKEKGKRRRREGRVEREEQERDVGDVGDVVGDMERRKVMKDCHLMFLDENQKNPDT